MNRVMIVGQPGSGKSTLARAIGHIAKLPVVHVDMIHWMPGWVERDHTEKLRLAHLEEAKEHWVFEGGLSSTWDTRLARADMLVFLDIPLRIRLWRVTLRTLRHYGQSRPDLPQGCPERFSLEFFHFIWRTRQTGRQKMLKLLESARGKEAHHLKSAPEVQGFLDRLRARYA
jgi:adenylate kinase family enzyme